MRALQLRSLLSAVLRGFPVLPHKERFKLYAHRSEYLSGFERRRFVSCDKNKIEALIRFFQELVVEDPERFTDNSSRTVSFDRVADLFTRDDAASVPAAGGGSVVAHEAVARAAAPLFIKVSEFAVFFYNIKPFRKIAHRISM